MGLSNHGDPEMTILNEGADQPSNLPKFSPKKKSDKPKIGSSKDDLCVHGFRYFLPQGAFHPGSAAASGAHRLCAGTQQDPRGQGPGGLGDRVTVEISELERNIYRKPPN
jgi:hypothetical protein